MMPSSLRLARLCLWLCLCSVPSAARGQVIALSKPVCFVPVGVSSSLVRLRGERGVVPSYGLEASVAQFHFDSVSWLGAFLGADLLGDGRRGRIVLGPELGWLLFGADAGLVLSADRDGVGLGARARGHVTFFGSSVYVGYGTSSHLGAHERGAHPFYELGLMLKYPIQVPDDSKR
jgi:hypothetical protein